MRARGGSHHHAALVSFAEPHTGNKDLDSWPLSLLSKSGRVFSSTISVKGEACKAKRPPAEKPALTVSPARVSLCADEVTLVAKTTDFQIEHAYLGTVGADGVEAIGEAGKERAYLLRFTEPAKGNRAMSTWPLTLVAKDGKLLASSVQTEGTPKDCSPPAPPKPDLAVALSGPLNVCIPQESLTVVGSGADSVSRGELLGVVSSTVKTLDKQTAVLAFTPPIFQDKKHVGASTVLRLTVGGKLIELEIPLRCDK